VESVENISALICGRCATVCDLDDKFCRHCGMALGDDPLPLKRDQHLPDVRPRVPAAVVRAAAVIAVGTITEIMARRLAREAGRRVASVTRLPIGRAKRGPQLVDDEPSVVSDTVFIRRVQMRR